MADGVPTSSAAPDGQPPKMEVGFNYPWPFDKYGTAFGPREIVNRPQAPAPSGATSAIPVFRDPVAHPPAGSLDRNLRTLKKLNINKVRMFILCNAFNYGNQPAVLSSGTSIFSVPIPAHPQFFDHFRQMLQVFVQNGMQVMPSLLDFGAIYKFQSGSGGGRTDVLTSQRTQFFEFMLLPMLQEAAKADVRQAVFAFEIMNEPFWNISTSPKRPGAGILDIAAETTPLIMTTFLTQALAVIEGNGFLSSVGHRTVNDLLGPMPPGQLAQFHYYGKTSLIKGGTLAQDPDPIPKRDALKASLASKLDSKGKPVQNVICGEFSTRGNGDLISRHNPLEQGLPWPELDGRDTQDDDAAFERLCALARKGYDLAFVWPDLADNVSPIKDQDALKLSSTARDSIKRFTRGRFPNGIPRDIKGG